VTCPDWPGPSLTAPDSGQGICRGIDRCVVCISPHDGYSPAATTPHHTGPNTGLKKRATVNKQRKAGVRSCQNRVGIRSASGVTSHVHDGIVLLGRMLTHVP